MKSAGQKFKNELMAVLNRWSEESDLEEFEMLSLAVEALNARMDEPILYFESDMDGETEFDPDFEL